MVGVVTAAAERYDQGGKKGDQVSERVGREPDPGEEAARSRGKGGCTRFTS